MTCARAFCTRAATVEVAILDVSGEVEDVSPYCREHGAEITSCLIPTYHDGRPAFTTTAIA